MNIILKRILVFLSCWSVIAAAIVWNWNVTTFLPVALFVLFAGILFINDPDSKVLPTDEP